ncbi:MAG: AMIN domain-containing protein [Desulfomonile tiedjei]|nr:AMIN domain-containing protein [Desulfomonile tiedjei]
MSLKRRICASLVWSAALVAIVSGASYAMPTGKITEVSVSPDLKRVTIKSDGIIGPHTVSTASNPSRLIIDVEGASVATPPPAHAVSKASGLAVKAVKNQSGARVVMDFGASPLPVHKIRRLGNYLLVFLQEWEPTPAASGRITPDKVPVAEPTPAVVRRRIEKPLVSSTSNLPIKSSSDLSIKSAEVSDGLIILTLANRERPGMIYRIDLGVDFEKLGFSTAKISATNPGTRSEPIKISARRSPFWMEETQVRIGPRKSPPPSATVQERAPKLEQTVKLSSRPW